MEGKFTLYVSSRFGKQASSQQTWGRNISLLHSSSLTGNLRDCSSQLHVLHLSSGLSYRAVTVNGFLILIPNVGSERSSPLQNTNYSIIWTRCLLNTETVHILWNVFWFLLIEVPYKCEIKNMLVCSIAFMNPKYKNKLSWLGLCTSLSFGQC